MAPTRMQHCYDPRPESCAKVRRDLHAFLATSPLDEDTIADAVLVTNELACNAVDHARTRYELVVTLAPGYLTIELTDGSAASPMVQAHDITASRGRGLQLVDTLAPGWVCHHHVGGKTITARITTIASSDPAF